MKLSSLAALLLCVVFFAVTTAAQTTSTEILGTVADSSGAVVPGAKVRLLRVTTGERRETATDSSGGYSFPLIEIGEYTVTAEAPGFKPLEKTRVTLQLQQRARVKLELSVG